MAHTIAYNTVLEKDRLYHIFNRAVGNELLFRSEENYRYFLKKYSLYLSESLETISFCLLPNHFHLFIKVNDERNISQNFKRLFQSYSLAYNRYYKRKGALFDSPFKRKEVVVNDHISLLIRYIHQNSQKHGYIDDFKQWYWSSWNEGYSENQSRVTSSFMENWFLSRAEFNDFHGVMEGRSSLE